MKNIRVLKDPQLETKDAIEDLKNVLQLWARAKT